MKLSSLILATALVAGAALSTAAADKKAADANKGKLRHVVAFKFKESATKEQIQKVTEAFRDLKKKIPQIAKFEGGTNNSPEQKNKGFTHAFILSFDSEQDRDVYLPHPAHKEFGKLVGPLLDDVFVFDFWTKEKP